MVRKRRRVPQVKLSAYVFFTMSNREFFHLSPLVNSLLNVEDKKKQTISFVSSWSWWAKNPKNVNFRIDFLWYLNVFFFSKTTGLITSINVIPSFLFAKAFASEVLPASFHAEIYRLVKYAKNCNKWFRFWISRDLPTWFFHRVIQQRLIWKM